MPGLQAGDEFELELDPEWLPLDALPLEGAVWMALEALGFPEAIRVQRGGLAVELRGDSEAGLLTGEGISDLLGPFAPTVRMRIVQAGTCPALEPVAPRVPVAVDWPSEGLELAPEGLDLLADALAGRRRHDPLAHLHRQALELSLSQALDVLMGERQLRDLEPFDYQRAVVRRVLGRLRGNAILADEVGLGKTVEAGMVLLEYQARGLVRRTLVLVPPSLVGQWAGELRRHFNVPLVTQDEPAFAAAGAEAWHAFHTVVASIATARREPHRSAILSAPYDLVIVDEAHHLRNASTAAWGLVSQLRKRFMLLLTATPIQNDLKELFNLVTLLKPGQLDTFKHFKKRFIGPDGAKNVEELRRHLTDVMIRNRRSQTGLNLPPRRARTVSVAATADEARVYERIAGLVRQGKCAGWSARDKQRLRTLQLAAGSSPAALAAGIDGDDTAEARALREALQAVEAPAKTLRLVQALQELEGEKVVVFTQFRATLEHLAAFLARTGFAYRVFHGSLTRLEKDRAMASFAGETQLLLCTESGSEGWNLQFCRNLINFDLPWNPMRIEQRLGRLHRIGQTREVRVTNLVTHGTLEHDLIDVLERKLHLFELVVGEMDLILGDVEEEASFEEIVFDAWASAGDDAAARANLEGLGDRLHEAKKAVRFQQELNDSVLGDALGGEAGG